MNRIISICVLVGVLIINDTSAQEKCDISKLSDQDKAGLKKFWIELKNSVDSKKNSAFNKLCHFPFTCSFCASDSSNFPYVLIGKNNFNKYKNQLFYNKNFIEVISKNEILRILQSDIQENGSCALSFSFPIIKPSIRDEGLQGFFSLKKVNGKYKIVSAWTVP